MDLAEAILFFLASIAYLWWLAGPAPWSGIVLIMAAAASWRRRSLTKRDLGLRWTEFRASARSWLPLWIFTVGALGLIEGASFLRMAALRHLAVAWAWAAVQQVVFLSMTYLPLRAHFRSTWRAALLAGLAFSLMHLPNAVLVPATYLWGVASCLLYERCRSAWGLALMQAMLTSALYAVAPAGWSRNFRIGPFY